MTKDEVTQIESWIEEGDIEARVIDGQERIGKYIRFTPVMRLHHDGQPMNRFDNRHELASYLRRIAAHLEA